MPLEITLLGDVTIRDTETDAPPRVIRGEHERVAVAMLVLEPHPVSRDALVKAIWPEELPQVWASAVRTVISRVRGALGSMSSQVDVAASAGRYKLHLPVDTVVDVVRVDRALGQAREAFGAGRPAEARRLAEEATARLRRPFLDDADGGDWAVEKRELFAGLHLVALETIGEAAIELDDPTAALSAANGCA